MNNAVLLDIPTITDWISAISSIIGVPLALWSFVKLVSRDKEREKQIESLTKIASQMNDQVMQLEIQSSEFKNQTYLLIEHNKLIEKQIELQSEALHNTTQIEIKRVAFEKQKRLIEIRPYFEYSGGSRSGSDFIVEFTNKGKDSSNIEVQVDSETTLINIQHQKQVDAGRKLNVYTNIKRDSEFDYTPKHLDTYSIDIFFTDVDGNKYKQSFPFKNGTLIPSSPELI